MNVCMHSELIQYYNPSQVTKTEVDNYLPGKWIPHVELEAHPIGDSVTRLVYKVDLLGAKPPRNKFMLSYIPTQVVQEGIYIASYNFIMVH